MPKALPGDVAPPHCRVARSNAAQNSKIVDPPHALVLFGSPADVGKQESWAISTWQFAIVPQADGSSRLLTRGRSDYTPGFANRLFFGRFPIEAITFTMSRKMLLEIKRLAERGSAPQ